MITREEIKRLHDKYTKQIKSAAKDLEDLRSICEHPITYVGLYSWRIGCIDEANICADCGKMVGLTNPPQPNPM